MKKPLSPKVITMSESKSVVLGNHAPFSMSLTTGRLILAKKKEIDIASPDNGVMGQMFIDPVVLAENVWKIYGDRICKAGIETEEEFYELLDDKGNKALDTAFKNSVTDFFTWGQMFVDQVNQAYGSMSKKVEEELKDQPKNSPSQETLGEESGNTQES